MWHCLEVVTVPAALHGNQINPSPLCVQIARSGLKEPVPLIFNSSATILFASFLISAETPYPGWQSKSEFSTVVRLNTNAAVQTGDMGKCCLQTAVSPKCDVWLCNRQNNVLTAHVFVRLHPGVLGLYPKGRTFCCVLNVPSVEHKIHMFHGRCLKYVTDHNIKTTHSQLPYLQVFCDWVFGFRCFYFKTFE